MTRYQDRLALMALLAILLIAVAPILLSEDRLNLHCDGDSFSFYARHEHFRKAVLEYHVFPQRTPFFGGGVTPFADPEDPSLSPFILVTLILGTVRGLKILQILLMAAGVAGMYLLLRESLRASPLSAAAGALVFGLSPTIPIRVLDGNPNEIYYSLVPLCIYCLHRARQRSRFLLAASALLGLIMLDGKLSFATSSLYCATLAFVSALPGVSPWAREPAGRPERLRDLRLWGVATIIAIGLGAYRIVPAMAGITQAGGLREMKLLFRGDTYGGMPLSDFVAQLVDWNGAGRSGLSSHTVGWLPLICVVLCLVLKRRRALPWICVGVFFGLLEMGRSAPIDIFHFLYALPVFDKIGNPTKYFAPLVVITIGIMTAIALDALSARMPKHATMAQGMAIAGIIVFLFPRIYDVNAKTYTGVIPAAYLEPSHVFYQVRGEGLPRGGLGIPGEPGVGGRPAMCPTDARPIQANAYVNLLRGLGTIDWYTAMPLAEYAVPRVTVSSDGTPHPNGSYRGECYREKSGSRVPCSIQPNRIVVAEGVDASDVLLINQNFDPDWRSPEGQVYSRHGLMAVGGGIRAGTVLTFTSRPLRVGAIVSVLFLTGLAVLATRYRRARGSGAEQGRLVRMIRWMIGP